jgi:uncharacterized protein YjgD (DUF1641 family)
MARIFPFIILCLVLINCKNDQKDETVSTNSVKNQSLKDYIDFKYDKVIAFASVNPMDYFDGNFDKELNVKKFKDTVSRSLTPNQIKNLNDILSGRKNRKTDSITAVSDCFYPRHNIIFLDKNKKIVNYIVVCFECNQIKSNKPTSASMKNFEDFFNSIGLKVFYNPYEHKKYYDSLKLANKK